MAVVDDAAPRSESHELVRLGLEMLGVRGVAIAGYFERRRDSRHRERLQRLSDATASHGVDVDTLLGRIEEDDRFQELFECLAATAQRSRYDEKIAYLGRVLANAASARDGTKLDLAWLRMHVVEDLDPMHVQLLWLISVSPGDRWRAADERAIRRRAEEDEIDLAAFEAGLGLLRRHGLIEEIPDLELNIEIEIDEPPKGEMPSQATAEGYDSEVTVGWKLTQLGREILDALRTAADGNPTARAPTEA